MESYEPTLVITQSDKCSLRFKYDRKWIYVKKDDKNIKTPFENNWRKMYFGVSKDEKKVYHITTTSGFNSYWKIYVFDLETETVETVASWPTNDHSWYRFHRIDGDDITVDAIRVRYPYGETRHKLKDGSIVYAPCY